MLDARIFQNTLNCPRLIGIVFLPPFSFLLHPLICLLASQFLLEQYIELLMLSCGECSNH